MGSQSAGSGRQVSGIKKKALDSIDFGDIFNHSGKIKASQSGSFVHNECFFLVLFLSSSSSGTFLLKNTQIHRENPEALTSFALYCPIKDKPFFPQVSFPS